MHKGLVARDPHYMLLPDGSIDKEAQDVMGAHMEALGVTWTRLELRSDVDPGVYQYFLEEVAPRHKINVLALLGFGLVPDLAPHTLNSGFVRDDDVYGGGVNVYMKRWLDAARSLLMRYEHSISAVEVLNEHNRLDPTTEIASITARLPAPVLECAVGTHHH